MRLLVALAGALAGPGRTRTVILVLIGSLALWEAATLAFRPEPFVLPAPSAVFAEIGSDVPWYANHAMFTLGATLMGFGLAVLAGTLAAIGIVYSRVLEHTLYTLLVSLNSIPKIALAPLFVIWMSTGAASKVAIAMTIALWPVVIDTVLGLRSVEPEVLEMARSMRATRWQVFFKIRLPNALPYMFSGMKVAISMALVGAIGGEFVASEVGLGYAILVAQGQFKTDVVFAAIILLGIMGTLLFFLVVLVERLFVTWHVTHRADAHIHTA